MEKRRQNWHYIKQDLYKIGIKWNSAVMLMTKKPKVYVIM